MYMHRRGCLWRQTWVRSPGAGVIVSYELPNMGARPLEKQEMLLTAEPLSSPSRYIVPCKVLHYLQDLISLLLGLLRDSLSVLTKHLTLERRGRLNQRLGRDWILPWRSSSTQPSHQGSVNVCWERGF